MNQGNYNGRFLNELSRKLISFHDQGYVLDFKLAGKKRIVCLQENHSFFTHNVVIKERYRCFDVRKDAYKVIYTVDTCCGCRGLMMRDEISEKKNVFNSPIARESARQF